MEKIPIVLEKYLQYLLSVAVKDVGRAEVEGC